MPNKWHHAEGIVTKLRQVEEPFGEAVVRAGVIREVRVPAQI